jgi:hypothetical protein
MVNGYAQTSEKIALSKLLGGRVLAPLRAALSFSPSPPSRAPGAQNFLDLVSNTNATSNKITRWPLHITTPRSSTTNSHTTCLDVTEPAS